MQNHAAATNIASATYHAAKTTVPKISSLFYPRQSILYRRISLSFLHDLIKNLPAQKSFHLPQPLFGK